MTAEGQPLGTPPGARRPVVCVGWRIGVRRSLPEPHAVQGCRAPRVCSAPLKKESNFTKQCHALTPFIYSVCVVNRNFILLSFFFYSTLRLGAKCRQRPVRCPPRQTKRWDAQAGDAGVWALRLDYGAGSRVYAARRGTALVLLRCGGETRPQEGDLQLAHASGQASQHRSPQVSADDTCPGLRAPGLARPHSSGGVSHGCPRRGKPRGVLRGPARRR